LADIEMGRQVTGARNPVVLYVSGGNTQVCVDVITGNESVCWNTEHLMSFWVLMTDYSQC